MLVHIINSIIDTFNIYDYFVLLVFIFYIFNIFKDIKNLRANRIIIRKVAIMYCFACILFMYFLIEYAIIQRNLIVLFPLGIICFLAELIIQKTIKGDESNMELVTKVINDIRKAHPCLFDLMLSMLFSLGLIAFLSPSLLKDVELKYNVLAIFVIGMILYISSVIELKLTKRKRFLDEIKNSLKEDTNLILGYVVNGETDKAIKLAKAKKTRVKNEMFRLDISLDTTNKQIILEIKDNDDNVKETDIVNYDV